MAFGATQKMDQKTSKVGEFIFSEFLRPMVEIKDLNGI